MSEKLRNKIGENEELRQKEGSDCSTYNENAGNLEKDEERKGVGECTDIDIRLGKIKWLIGWAAEHSDEDINLLISLYQSSLQDL